MKTCYIFPESRTIADLVPPGELTAGWTITRINVPIASRGKGLGTKMLKRICSEANIARVDLWLEIFPSGPLDYEQLKAWYERHSFRLHPATGYMIRRWSE